MPLDITHGLSDAVDMINRNILGFITATFREYILYGHRLEFSFFQFRSPYLRFLAIFPGDVLDA